MSDPLTLALAAKPLAFEPEAPPPLLAWAAQDAASWPVGLLLVSALLLLLGALAGGLRTLLTSPLRRNFMAELSPERQRSLDALTASQPMLGSVAGLVRILLVFSAVLIALSTTGELGDLARWSAWVALFLVGGLLLEGVPALVSHGHGIRSVLLLMPLVRLMAVPLQPLVWLIGGVIRGTGANPSSNPEDTLAGEMLTMARESEREEQLGDAERRMIARIMDLPENDAAKVMTPRTELVAMEAHATLAAALELSQQEGHSRIPVYEEDLDHVVGVFFVKDILERIVRKEDLARITVRECMREPLFVPETMKVPALFEELRRRRLHMAVVVDEYGGTSGVVTIEDLLEEIVGEIEDEHDPDATPAVQHVGPGEILVQGGLTVSELNDALGTELPEDEDFDTIAGLIFDRFGRIPGRGEELREDGVIMEVLEVDDRRVHRVRVRREAAASDSDAA